MHDELRIIPATPFFIHPICGFAFSRQSDAWLLEWPEQLETQARRFAQRLVIAAQGCLMLQHAAPAVAEAFLAGRIDAECGRVYAKLAAPDLPRTMPDQARAAQQKKRKLTGKRPGASANKQGVMMVKTGCAIMLVVFGAIFGGYYWLLQGLEFPLDLILALFGALGIVMLFSMLKQVIFGDGDGTAYKRALQGAPLREGAIEAVWGTIMPIGETIDAPFSGQPCVAYEYDAKKPAVKNDEGETQPQGSKMTGFALAPSVIRSSRGDVRLLGFSMLTNFPEENLRLIGDSLERAQRFLEATTFEAQGLVSAVLSQMDSAMANDAGAARKDWLITKREAIDLEMSDLCEKRIAAGDTVTAVGIWDPARGGLVPKLGNKKTMVKLRPGGGEEMVAVATKRPWGGLAFALVWCGFIHLFIYLALADLAN